MEIKLFIIKYGLAIFLLSIALVIVYIGIIKKSTIVKQICYNLSAVLIALFIYDIYLGLIELNGSKRHIETSNIYPRGSFKGLDKMLGYRPSKDSMLITIKKMYAIDSSIIYDATYTIINRIRYTPNTNLNSNKYVIFLGGSFMFGEGLNDDETFPYYLNELSNREFNVRNYAFGGYGTHQALSTVENIIIKDSTLLQAVDIKVYYLLIPNHIYRTTGRAVWDTNGPNYEIVNNQIVREGNFKDHNTFKKKYKYIYMIWRGSGIYKKFFRNFGEVTDYDVNKVVLMIKKMNDLLKNNGIKFYVIIDNELDNVKSTEPIIKMLDYENIPTFKVREIIEDIDEKKETYHIKGDGHPTKIYNELLARYLTRNLQ